jgi:glycosyltransferase involved in cell wall biosynthesis
MLKPKILVISQFPTEEKPWHYVFIKNRVEAIADDFEIVVLNILFNNKFYYKRQLVNHGNYLVRNIWLPQLRIPKIRALYFEYQARKTIISAIKSVNPSIIHIHFSSYYSWVAAKNALKKNIPYIITEHATFFSRNTQIKYFAKRIKFALEHASAIITVGNTLKNTVYNFIPKKIIVIPNTIDTELFNCGNTDSSVPVKTRAKAISVGGFTETDRKGFIKLIEAINADEYLKNNLELNIYGSGPSKNEAKQLVENYNLQKTIFIRDNIRNDELPSLYCSSDFYISNSKIETFGVTLIEAMSCGLPVLSTPSGGPEDFINDANGLLLENHNMDTLISGLKFMINSYSTFNPEEIRAFVIKNFSYTAYRKKILKVYDGLIGLR